MKSNLTEGQRNFIKEVKNEYPERGLRIRRVDTGACFVIEDAATDDDRIVDKLSNPVFYTESDDNPGE